MDVDDFKLRDAASYDESAAEYGRYVATLSEPLAVEICRLAGIRLGSRVLDVGCGTGVSSRRAAELVGATGSVVAVDLSAGMLADAERRSRPELESGILRFVRMDAEELEFEDDSFDAVVSLCAVLHFPRIERALAEMRRVLRPAGVAVTGIGAGRPSDALGVLRHASRRAVRKVAHPATPELRAPGFLIRLAEEELPPSEETLLTGWAGSRPLVRLAKAMQEAGFRGVTTSWHGHEVNFDSPEAFWDAQAAIVTEVRKRLLAADVETTERLRRRFLAEARDVLDRGGRLVYPYGAAFARGA